MVHFSKASQPFVPPPLKIGDQNLQYTQNAKFLGITFDSKLTFRPHLTTLKNECQKLLGIMKMVCAQNVGASQQFLLHMYKIYIRGKLDYGAIVYCSASLSDLKVLDVIDNEALRIATGAFKSSPVESLYVLTGEMKPSERREYLTIRYYLKIKASLHNPTNLCISDNQNSNRTLLRNNNQNSFIIRCEDIQRKYDLPRFLIRPDFSYHIHNCIRPMYAIQNPNVNLELASHPKTNTSTQVFQQLFYRIKHLKYQGYTCIYTDGSKSSRGVGAAAVSDAVPCVASLPKESSIYFAEIYAIQMALDYIYRSVIINNQQERKYVVFSDSMGSLLSLHNRSNHPVAQYILQKIHKLSLMKYTVEFCWIPGHMGIQGNEKADAKAVEASSRSPEFIPIFYRDYFTTINSKFLQERNRSWLAQANPPKIRHIKPDLTPWPKNELRRNEEVVLNRLRIGHTNLTHKHLMEAIQIRVPPVCQFCEQATQTVKHIFLECPELTSSRQLYFGRPTANLDHYLGVNCNPAKIFLFLRANHLFSSI